MNIETEIKFFTNEMGKIADGMRSVARTGHGTVRKSYAMAAMPAQTMTPEQEKRFKYCQRAAGEIMKMKTLDQKRIAELRAGMPAQGGK